MYKSTIAEPAYKALELIEKANLPVKFYLAGGTAVSIQLGHRISVDLDFFTRSKFVPEDIITSFDILDIKLQNIQLKQGTMIADLQDAQISFFYYAYPLLLPVIPFEHIQLASLLDIALMKLTAVASRGAKKDFIDLYFIFKELDIKEVFSKFGEKFAGEKFDKYHYLKSLVYFDDADVDPDPNMLVEWNWKKIKEYFKEVSKSILL